jgi:DNA-directed RNA polymerase specialized sigma24 family protein
VLSASSRHATRRARITRPAPAVVATRATAAPAGTRIERRSRVAWVLGRAPHDKRLVLALLLVERLTPAEAASALGVPVRHVRGSYTRALADLRRAAAGGPAPARSRRALPRTDRFRKAS